MTAAAIDGTIVSGLGAASQTLTFQLPYLTKQFPEIAKIRVGSINLQLDIPLRINKPTFVTEPIAWVPGHPNHSEKFGFLRVQLECPIGGPIYSAWIYIPYNSPHRYNLFGVEIIAEDIPEALGGARVRVHLRGDVQETKIFVVT